MRSIYINARRALSGRVLLGISVTYDVYDGMRAHARLFLSCCWHPACNCAASLFLFPLLSFPFLFNYSPPPLGRWIGQRKKGVIGVKGVRRQGKFNLWFPLPAYLYHAGSFLLPSPQSPPHLSQLTFPSLEVLPWWQRCTSSRTLIV